MSNLTVLNLTSGSPTDSGTVGTIDALIANGLVGLASIINTTSVLTRPADVFAYAQNDLIASSTTAGSIVVPTVSLARAAAGSFCITGCRLYSSVTTGWDQSLIRLRMWVAAPTYTNGDNGAYVVATGAASYLGYMDIVMNQFADGAAGIGAPSTGFPRNIKLASGQTIAWDLQLIGAAVTPISGQTFTFAPEVQQTS